MLGLWFLKSMFGCVALNCCIFAREAWRIINVILVPLRKGFIEEALRIINADRSVRVPGTNPENGWEEEVSCWKPEESPHAPTSNSDPALIYFPPPF